MSLDCMPVGLLGRNGQLVSRYGIRHTIVMKTIGEFVNYMHHLSVQCMKIEDWNGTYLRPCVIHVVTTAFVIHTFPFQVPFTIAIKTFQAVLEQWNQVASELHTIDFWSIVCWDSRVLTMATKRATSTFLLYTFTTIPTLYSVCICLRNFMLVHFINTSTYCIYYHV